MKPATLSTELKAALKSLRLGPVLEALPERIVLAEKQARPLQDFLLLILSDEIARRQTSAYRADALLRKLRQSRMDNSRDALMTELTTVDVLIIDDFALEPMTRDESRDAARSERGRPLREQRVRPRQAPAEPSGLDANSVPSLVVETHSPVP